MDVGEHVAIGNEEWFRGPWIQQADGAGRAQRAALMQVFDLHAETRAVTEVLLDHVPQVMHGDHESIEPLAARAFEDVLQHGLAVHRQQRLRAVLRVRQQPRALAARHDDHGVGAPARRQQIVQQVQADHAAIEVDNRHRIEVVGAHELQHRLAPKLRRYDQRILLADVEHRPSEIQAAQQSTPNIAVGDRTHQRIIVADHEYDLHAAARQVADRLLQRAVGRHQRLAPAIIGTVVVEAQARSRKSWKASAAWNPEAAPRTVASARTASTLRGNGGWPSSDS
jgi:hypothetical protein